MLIIQGAFVTPPRIMNCIFECKAEPRWWRRWRCIESQEFMWEKLDYEPLFYLFLFFSLHKSQCHQKSTRCDRFHFLSPDFFSLPVFVALRLDYFIISILKMASKIYNVDLSFDHTWTISPNVCYRRGVPCVWFRRKIFLISGRIDHQQWQHVVAQLCASPTIHWTRNEECTGSGSGFLTGLNEYLMEIDVCLLMKKQFLFAANHRIHHLPLRPFFYLQFCFNSKAVENDDVL